MRIFSLKRFTRSFRAALRGMQTVLREEQTFRIQLVIALGVIASIFIFDVAHWEAVALSMMAVLVLVLELLNTVFERVIDMTHPRLSPYVGAVKDILAGTVLMASLGALIIGGFILWPHLVRTLMG